MKKDFWYTALFLTCMQSAVATVPPPLPSSNYDPNAETVTTNYGNLVEEDGDVKNPEPQRATPPGQVQRHHDTTKERARPRQATPPSQAEPGLDQSQWPTITNPHREQQPGEMIKPPPQQDEGG